MKPFLFDIDTQFDFLDPRGALYVPNNIRPTLKFIMDVAVTKSLPVISTIDSHMASDEEFKTFPAHCISGSDGAKKIPETIVYGQGLFHKNTLNVWNHDHTNYIRREIQGFDTAFVMGVATEFCVKAAVMGCINNHITPLIIIDAVAGLENHGVAINEMISAGAGIIHSKHLISLI